MQGLSVKQTDDIETLNELARRIQEFTDDRTLCKFEAALELEQCDSLEQALHIAENLDCYSYDPQMYSMAAYTRYLFRELEINIDDPAFATFDFQGYGERQLGLLESVQTAYGMITRNEDFLIQAQPVSYTHLDVYKRQVSEGAKYLLPPTSLHKLLQSISQLHKRAGGVT